MALQRQSVPINFGQGIDTKTDPYQVQVGKFLALSNSVFTTAGRLTKRNGFQNITSLPNSLQTTLTTLGGNLIATGSNLYAFSEDTDQWLPQGTVQPVQLAVQPLVRVSTSQSQPDAAITSLGLTCLVYVDTGVAYYQVSDSKTGQQIVKRTALPSTATNPRAFLLGVYFIITFIATVGGTPTLQYIAIPTATPGTPNAPATIGTAAALTAPYDAYFVSNNNRLYVSWLFTTTLIHTIYITNLLSPSVPAVLGATPNTTSLSITADVSPGINMIWVSSYDNVISAGAGQAAAYDYSLTPVVLPTEVNLGPDVVRFTTVAIDYVMTMFVEIVSTQATDPSSDIIVTDSIWTQTLMASTVVLQMAAVGPFTNILRSVGLASKPFVAATGVTYMLVAYGSEHQTNPDDNSNQPTYFLIDSLGNIYMRLAYSNGGGYATSQVLPTVTLVNGEYLVPYLITDFLATVNKGTALPPGTPSNAIYTQKGVNLALFSLNTFGQLSSEIAGALHLTGGMVWEYDGVKPVEFDFHVWPENIESVSSTTGGLISDVNGPYYWVFTYEWTDNAGNLHRSAPSIPYTTPLSSATSSVIFQVPTLRLTYKQPFLPPTNQLVTNPIRIVGYRWSTAQQIYYQFTSLTNPTLNDTTIDYVFITDTSSDAQILGNTLLYTTGGVIEDIAPPACIASALFTSRLFLIDAEDRNLLWFSKQVIESVPVEFSDLLTLYIAPTTGAQGSTGPLTALSAMDDKLIVFKADAIYYINGTGPDNTGANSTFSDPIFITSAVGCSNPQSTVLMPNGVMFQSDKGIWILGRDLSTNYIGAPVEQYNSNTVMSATAIPGTNQVRFVLDNNITLVYDYYFAQWSTHTNVSAISATLYQGSHTYLNSFGQIFQETPGLYMDGTNPVLMSLMTSWLNVAGLQGYERFYFAFLLGTYLSPFKLDVQIAYDYNSSPEQATIITPDNQSQNWGGEAQWGSGNPWGGSVNGNVFQARLFPQKQKCESFQLTISELYDPSFNQPPGEGLTLSGLNLVIGVKKGYRTQKASQSFG
jgi:hypothetical protein